MVQSRHTEIFRGCVKKKVNEQLRPEFNKRTKSLKLDDKAKEELFNKFIVCWDSGFRCFYCKKRMDLHFENEHSFTIDHTTPKAKNGKDKINNLEFICRDCNFQKKVMGSEEYRTKMEKIKSRKQKMEYWKARKAAEKDKQIREAYKDIFERASANENKPNS